MRRRELVHGRQAPHGAALARVGRAGVRRLRLILREGQSAIAAVKLHFPDRRLMVVFEPHTFTWRNREAIAAYDDVFEGATRDIHLRAGVAGAGTHAQLTQDEIVARVRSANFDAEPFVDPQEAALQRLDGILQSRRRRAPAHLRRAWRPDQDHPEARGTEVSEQSALAGRF